MRSFEPFETGTADRQFAVLGRQEGLEVGGSQQLTLKQLNAQMKDSAFGCQRFAVAAASAGGTLMMMLMMMWFGHVVVVSLQQATIEVDGFNAGRETPYSYTEKKDCSFNRILI